MTEKQWQERCSYLESALSDKTVELHFAYRRFDNNIDAEVAARIEAERKLKIALEFVQHSPTCENHHGLCICGFDERIKPLIIEYGFFCSLCLRILPTHEEKVRHMEESHGYQTLSLG